MQNDYILVDWGSVYPQYNWGDSICSVEITNNEIHVDNSHMNYVSITILVMIVYNLIILYALSIGNEKVLHRKNKTIKRR